MAQERGGGGGVVQAKKPISSTVSPRTRPGGGSGTRSVPVQGPPLPGYTSPAQTYQAPSNAPSGGGGGYGGGGGSYGGGGSGGGGGMQSMAAPVITPPSEEDYLAGDSGFQTQLSALQGALQRYLADSDFQRTNYTTDYKRSLRDLGYDEDQKSWNWNDKLTASGRGYQNQLDDFASRGMLQSQGYADAYTELQRMLGQQYDALSGAKTSFMTDMDNQIANFRGENTSNQQAARAEALQRRAAQYAL